MNQFYVYAWFNDEWGTIPFYIGKGQGDRYKTMENRSLPFKSFVERWCCHSEILLDGMDEESAMRMEKRMKDGFILAGYPIIDAETAYRQKVCQAVGFALAKERGTVFGRPRKDTEAFEKYLKKQREGSMTVDQCCKELDISRSTWYDRVRAIV